MMREATTLLFAVLVLPSTVALSGGLWWQDFELEPKGTVILGLPLSDFDTSWSKASLLTIESLPASAKFDADRMRSDGVKFRHELDREGTGSHEQLLVGVYQTTAGARGRFVAILGRDSSGAADVRFVSKRPGRAGFSALLVEGDGISWIFCLGCDDVGLLRKDDGSWSIEWPPDYG